MRYFLTHLMRGICIRWRMVKFQEFWNSKALLQAFFSVEGINHNTQVGELKLSDLAKYTTYLAIVGEQWGVVSDFFGKKIRRGIRSALQ